MRIEGRRYRDEWLPNFYPSRQVGDRFVRISRTGKSQILTKEEDEQINQFFMDAALFRRLEATGHILTARNSVEVIHDLRTWLKGNYEGPQLHMIVATKRCNLDCTYCHMNPEPIAASKSAYDLHPETAKKIVDFIMQTPNPITMIEFQGGEAFLNFPIMKYVVEEARRQNQTAGKDLRFAVVSNLMVASDEQIGYCQEQGIQVSYTLNGPPDIHDHFRIARNGAGSFSTVMRKMEHFRKKFPGVLSPAPLCVVTADNAKDITRMIDFYYDLGFRDLAILYLKHLGNAVRRGVRFDVREFMKYYLEALDYIYEKNKKVKEPYTERLVQVALMKILSASDIPYVDWRNPVGYVSGAIVYDYDGEILPADEARSLKSVFSLGNVNTTTYDQLIRRKETFTAINLSLRDRDPECRECPYNPYCGVSPINHFAKTGELAPRPYESDECFIVISIMDWVFRKLMEDPLPLMRMVPGFSTHLKDIVKEMEQKPKACAV